MPQPAIGIAAASVGSSVIGAGAANKAAKAQERAADKQVNLQRDVFEEQKQMFTPYRQSGDRALAAYEYEMGLGPRPGATQQQAAQRAPVIIQMPAENALANGERAEALRRLGIVPRADGKVPMADIARAMSHTQNDKDETLVAQAFSGFGPKPDSPQYRVGDKTFATRNEAITYVNGQNALNTSTPTIDQNTSVAPASAMAGSGPAYRGFRATPGYKFRLRQGLDAVEASVGQRHSLVSGATQQALKRYGQDYAAQEHDKYMSRLGGLMQQGQASAAMTATAGNNYAQGAGNALANAGNAAASGAIGVGNAIQGGINNGLGAWMYGKGQGWWGGGAQA